MFYSENNFLAASHRITVTPVIEMSSMIMNPAAAMYIPPRSGLYLGIIDTPFLLGLKTGKNRLVASCQG